MNYKPKQTVKDIIDKLKHFPDDMPVSIGFDIFDDIEVSVKTWTHNNYPYDIPDIEFVCIE